MNRKDWENIINTYQRRNIKPPRHIGQSGTFWLIWCEYPTPKECEHCGYRKMAIEKKAKTGRDLVCLAKYHNPRYLELFLAQVSKKAKY